MRYKYFLICWVFFFTTSCNRNVKQQPESDISVSTIDYFVKNIDSLNNCRKIDLLLFAWKNYTNNYYLNRIIPQIEKISGIDASCQKGTYGYIYKGKSDSTFVRDYQKWCIKLKCNCSK